MKWESLQLIPQKYKGSWDSYEELCTSKLDKLEEMDKFLETYNLPRLNYEELENLYRLSTNKEIETVIKKLPTNKSPGPDSSTG